MVSIKKPLLLAFLISILFFNFSPAQKFIALDMYKWTGMKRIRFHVKDDLSFRLYGSRKFFTHSITYIGDSSIVLDGNWTIPISEISNVRVDRTNALTHALSRFLINLGIGFFFLDSFNSLINHNTPIIKPQVMAESTGLILSGIILQRVMISKYKINSRRILKVIDVTP